MGVAVLNISVKCCFGGEVGYAEMLDAWVVYLVFGVGVWVVVPGKGGGRERGVGCWGGVLANVQVAQRLGVCVCVFVSYTQESNHATLSLTSAYPRHSTQTHHTPPNTHTRLRKLACKPAMYCMHNYGVVYLC